MEHRTSAELKGFAEVIRPQTLSRRELIERWALAYVYAIAAALLAGTVLLDH
jgi:hypothetical protein